MESDAGFYAGFIVDQSEVPAIAKQLHRLMAHGLLDPERHGGALTVASSGLSG